MGMAKHLLLWAGLSLVTPMFVFVFSVINYTVIFKMQNIILFFWPSSILLMSLEGQKDFFSILKVWGLSIFINTVIYLFLGTIFFIAKKYSSIYILLAIMIALWFFVAIR